MTALFIELLVEVMLIVGAGAFVVIPLWISARTAKADSSSRHGGGSGMVAAR